MALNTLYGLKDAGFESLLVGGGVRDLLLGLSPKDFDVATNAEPEQVEEEEEATAAEPEEPTEAGARVEEEAAAESGPAARTPGRTGQGRGR